MNMVMEVKKLKKSYNNITVLNDINFYVNKGTITGLVGTSGGGKTTLLRCLHGIEEADAGDINISGHTGLVFQHFNLFPHMTVLENIIYTPIKVHKTDKQVAKKRAQELLDIIELPNKEDAYPHELSGGQKQRVAIVRALAPNPQILLLDEPTSALDPALSRKMANIMKRLSYQNISLILVSHDMEFLQNCCHNIMFLSQGRLIENCSCTKFFEKSQNPEVRSFLEHIDEYIEEL